MWEVEEEEEERLRLKGSEDDTAVCRAFEATLPPSVDVLCCDTLVTESWNSLWPSTDYVTLPKMKRTEEEEEGNSWSVSWGNSYDDNALTPSLWPRTGGWEMKCTSYARLLPVESPESGVRPGQRTIRARERTKDGRRDVGNYSSGV